MNLGRAIAILAAVASLAACSQKEPILPGERVGVRDALGLEAEAPETRASAAIALPGAVNRADVPQPGGNAAHQPWHAALSAQPALRWSTGIGSGNSRRFRITATPVVAGGVVYAMDARSHVTAVSTGGQALWTRDLTPEFERNQDAGGGGLAFGGGRLFATTGFGTLVALKPDTGEVLWTQRTEAPVTGAPVYSDGTVYVVSRDNRAWAVRAADGRVQWEVPGTPLRAGLIGGAAPAVAGDLAFFPLGSAELVAVRRDTGVRAWAASIAGQRRGLVYAQIDDIAADPVVVGGAVYAGNQAGRLVRLSRDTGERAWTAEEGAYGAILPVGGAVFVVSDQAQLVRLDAGSGDVVWAVDLPYFTKSKAKRRKAIHAHFGPVLAGGRLWVASDDGVLRAFSPESGAQLAQVALPGGAATRPVVAGQTLYVVSQRGTLHAFR
ncbi:PQQ-binding-like beta-propeller repeat protein [Rhodovulum adriaticum]|uniref:Outer membrane protein assembly factor BamB n=1 Tax=Rhodovulum adriaticum TaxID=35804 RepID=A0A4R2NVE7_RHOAD|nr:PQQ-binding-like beta-propeller repeat protein [Rhodovulum adriaticum]MBK1636204.1 quinoprotein [Rhodovulum adriaticum]TCP25524.1 outer membrane protein assembly factor BamB [Rhodovulum adriaticum]